MIVAQDLDLDEEIKIEPISWPTVEHNLFANDFLVAVVAGARSRTDVKVEQIEPEPMLWPKLTRWRHRTNPDARPGQAWKEPFIVPDGAMTLSYPGLGREQTFYVELVRADVRGGNQTLIDKLRKYAELHHQRLFEEVYGHGELRAVLIATTSATRAENLREMAATLPHGRKLFWFGCYEATDAKGRPMSTYTPENVFSPLWTDTNGESQSLIPSEATVPGAAASLSAPLPCLG